MNEEYWEKRVKELQAEVEEIGDSIKWWNNRYNALYEENKQLKERIDKAIKYIKKHTDKLRRIIVPKIDYNYLTLLEILKGDSNE